MRQTPKYPYPGPEALGFPRFDPQVPGIVPAAAAANPVITFRYGQWIGNAVEPLFVRPQYQPFPYFQQEALASPVIAFRYGRPLLDDPTVPVPGRHLPYPYFQEPVVPANPVIAYLRGQWFSDAIQPLVSLPRYLPFPYFQEAPANAVIAFRLGQWLGDNVQPLIGVTPHYFPFPYFEQPAPAPANPVIPIVARQLSELTAVLPGTIVSAPRYYPLVLPSPTPPPVPSIALNTEEDFRRRRLLFVRQP